MTGLVVEVCLVVVEVGVVELGAAGVVGDVEVVVAVGEVVPGVVEVAEGAGFVGVAGVVDACLDVVAGVDVGFGFAVVVTVVFFVVDVSVFVAGVVG